MHSVCASHDAPVLVSHNITADEADLRRAHGISEELGAAKLLVLIQIDARSQVHVASSNLFELHSRHKLNMGCVLSVTYLSKPSILTGGHSHHHTSSDPNRLQYDLPVLKVRWGKSKRRRQSKRRRRAGLNTSAAMFGGITAASVTGC